MRVGIMASGNLGFSCLQEVTKNYDVASILTDKSSTNIISFAAGKSIPCFIGNPRNGRSKDFLKASPIDILLSINYLFLVEQDILNWPSEAAINFHGSLLPKYRGRTPHVWAIINGETVTGVTAHRMTLGCDEGEVVASETVEISESDTGGTLLNKFTIIYPKLILEVLDSCENSRVKPKLQDEYRATYFEKRTPEDGGINWNWHKERIHNWVRAQAHPYPGAFTMINGKKVIVDQVSFDDYGFKQSQPNGLILTEEPCRVKTPNGVIILKQVRAGREFIAANSVFESL